MNLKSVYSKLFMGFLITLILSFSATGYYIVKRSSSNTQSVALEELKGRNEHIADLVEAVDEQDIRRILDDYAKTSKSAFHIEGGTLHDSFGKVQIGLVLDDASMKSMKDKEGVVKMRNHDNFYQYSKSYKIHNQVYIITVQKDVSKSASAFLDSFILSGVIMFLVGTVVFLVVSDIIVRPISKLTAATKELSKGNYKVRVGYAGDDEIGKLYVAFNKMAVELNKQEARRQQFISDVSHEFQTPLTAISGFAGILKMEDLPAEQRMKYADIIAFNAKRLSTLSKNMLQLTLLEGEDVQLEKSKYSLIDQLNRVIETEDNNALSKDIEIEFKHPRGDIEIVGDEARMEQVWINLIGNAIKYTDEHGVVTVDVRKTTKDIEVRVEDTGVGMSEEAISHIFERFYREDKSRSVEGNGLGLSIVKRIIDLHEFSLDVTSQEDVGSVFTVKIPYAPFSDFAKRLNIKRDKEHENTGKED